MKKTVIRRQRPLFHDGPDWPQLDETLRQQLVQRLADICYFLVCDESSQPLTCDQELPHDARKD